jgi:hypothetical protein
VDRRSQLTEHDIALNFKNPADPPGRLDTCLYRSPTAFRGMLGCRPALKVTLEEVQNLIGLGGPFGSLGLNGLNARLSAKTVRQRTPALRQLRGQ